MNFLFRMRDVITCLYTEGKDPVEREDMMIQQKAKKVTRGAVIFALV